MSYWSHSDLFLVCMLSSSCVLFIVFTEKKIELVPTTAMCSKHQQRALSCCFLCFAVKDRMAMLFLSLATGRQ